MIRWDIDTKRNVAYAAARLIDSSPTKISPHVAVQQMQVQLEIPAHLCRPFSCPSSLSADKEFYGFFKDEQARLRFKSRPAAPAPPPPPVKLDDKLVTLDTAAVEVRLMAAIAQQTDIFIKVLEKLGTKPAAALDLPSAFVVARGSDGATTITDLVAPIIQAKLPDIVRSMVNETTKSRLDEFARLLQSMVDKGGARVELFSDVPRIAVIGVQSDIVRTQIREGLPDVFKTDATLYYETPFYEGHYPSADYIILTENSDISWQRAIAKFVGSGFSGARVTWNVGNSRGAVIDTVKQIAVK